MKRTPVLLGTLLLLLLSALSGKASADEALVNMGPLNLCAELAITPCPDEMLSVIPTSVDIIDLDNNCQMALGNFGPTVYYGSDAVFGKYEIRAYVQSIEVGCRKSRDLTATVENVPLTNTSNGSPHVQSVPCLNSTFCVASAGWARRDLFGIAPPICYVASATATADTAVFGPYFAGTGGVACMGQ